MGIEVTAWVGSANGPLKGWARGRVMCDLRVDRLRARPERVGGRAFPPAKHAPLARHCASHSRTRREEALFEIDQRNTGEFRLQDAG